MMLINTLRFVFFVLTACIAMAFVSGFAKAMIKHLRNGGLD